MKVIKIINPLVTLPHISKDKSGNFEQAIIYVSGKNLCVSENDSEYTLTFSPSAKLTCSDGPMKWDELKAEIDKTNERRYSRNKQQDKINGQCDLFYEYVFGFRDKNSCTVVIGFHKKISVNCETFRINDKDIPGLP